MGLFTRHDDYVSPFDTDDTPDYVSPDVEAARISQQVDAEQDQREHIARIRKQQDAKVSRSEPTQSTHNVQMPTHQPTQPVRQPKRRPIQQSKQQPRPNTTTQNTWHGRTTAPNTQNNTGKRSGFAVAALIVAIIAVVNFESISSMLFAIVAVVLAIIAIPRTGAHPRKSGRGMAIIALVLAILLVITQTAAIIAQRAYLEETITEHAGAYTENESFTVSDHSGRVYDYNDQAYDITIDHAAYGLTEDYDGNPQLLISLTVTNASDEERPLSRVDVDALQNGIALDRSYGFESNQGTQQLGFADADDFTTIDAGQTQTVTVAFTTQDGSSPFLVYICGDNEATLSAFEFEDGQSAGPLTQIDADDMDTPPQAGEADREGMTTLVDYGGQPRISLRFESVRQGPQDYNGNETVILTLTWINETDRPHMLSDFGVLDLMQNGHELDTSYPSEASQDYDWNSTHRLAMPGVLMRATIFYTPATNAGGTFDASFDAYDSSGIVENTFSIE
ncbi:DUF4190 domain-containing protein [Bifidobacterium oedipodis]|uniref:DUF5067 domain-containing protein n=1 Tax=Bifidobacterium oedipodis TaxID=2675322 RepID=A0A7Y0HRI5_9BIFI|nr:DUF4190 domain-containing protein [Bifidobacterium sp. DSM 109957]NMM92926.1 hypothetical protein [Bifidobacterium sp. DSM 109957]